MSDVQQDRPSVPHHGAAHTGHGNSVAAWTGVIVVILGFLVMAIAVVVTTLWLFVAGAVACALGPALGKILAGMGFGVSGKPGH